MQYALEAVGAVQDGSLMQAGVHVREGGNVDDGAPAEILPVAGQDVHGTEGTALQEVGYSICSQRGGDVVHKAVAAKEQRQHTNQDDQGDEMRGGKNSLQHFGGALALQSIECQRHDDGQRETDDETQDAQNKGIGHQRPKLHVVEKADEVVKADPMGQRPDDRVAGHVILEGDQDAIDGHVVEQKYHQHSWKQQQQPWKTLSQPLPTFGTRWFDRSNGARSGFCCFHLISPLLCLDLRLRSKSAPPQNSKPAFAILPGKETTCCTAPSISDVPVILPAIFARRMVT